MVVDCLERRVSAANDSICAVGDIRFNVKGVCKGDSGGGLISLNSTFIGVLSAGYFCGEFNEPAIYCDVFLYRKWIENTLEYLDLQSKAEQHTKFQCPLCITVLYVIIIWVH